MSKNSLTPFKTNMPSVTPAEIQRLRAMTGLNLDEPTVLQILFYQQTAGLSLMRGELAVLEFKGKPTLMVTKKGYVANASKFKEYKGYTVNTSFDTGANDFVSVCTVYRTDRELPTVVKLYLKEWNKGFGLWREKPKFMLEKTCISHALAEAFPLPSDMLDVTGQNGIMNEGEV